MTIYTKSYPVTAESIDNFYRFSPSGVILFLQDAIASDMATWHAAAFDIAPDGLLWVVLEYNIQYDNPVPYWSDIVDVSVSVTEISPMKVYFDFAMKGHDGRKFALGNSVWSLLDVNSHRPYMATHDFVIKKSGLDMSEMTVRHPRKKFRNAGECCSSIEYRTQSTDVDFNGHICNRTYLPIALDCFSEEFTASHSIKSLYVKYIKETYLGDTISCKCYQNDDGFVCDMRNGQDEEVCQISISWEVLVSGGDVRDVVCRK